MNEPIWYKSWPDELPKSLKPYPEIPIFKFLEESARQYPDRTAIKFMGKTYTFQEIYDDAQSLSASFSDMGIGKGDIVALLLPNTPQFVISYYAILMTGATVTMCSPLHSEREMIHQLNDSGSETLITINLKRLFKLVDKIKSKTKLKRIIVSKFHTALPTLKGFLFKLFKRSEIAKIDWNREDIYSFEDLLDNENPPPNVIIKPKEDMAHLAYTGGTTGLPKGAVITHYNATCNVLQTKYWIAPAFGHEIPDKLSIEKFPQEDNPITLVVVPWFHAMGTIAYLNFPICSATTMIVLPRFEPVQWMEMLKKEDVEAVGGAPTLFIKILGHEKFPEYEKYFESLKLIGSGAGPLAKEHLKKLNEISSGVVMEAYGMTEVSMGCVYNPCTNDGVRKVGSVGIPFYDSYAKIVDLETGKKEMPIGEKGEVTMKGPQVMQGYWNKPKETEKVLRDGWMYSGDIGYMDEDGYIFLVDRKKDMIKHSGYNIYPRNLEEVLYEHPDVKEAAVIGIPDPEKIEIPKAYVVLKEGATVSKSELLDFVHQHVAKYEKIRELEFVDEVPMSETGKILRRKLREKEGINK
ncbi:MAG: AMP-binding protein [Candidatus Lokiarchaeota archaeon]|nr:AMP-binding protein [Candidatus Lokiarchaeota archaeon]